MKVKLYLAVLLAVAAGAALLASPAWAAIGFVQAISRVDTNSNSTQTTISTTAGNTVIVVVALKETYAVTSVTDTGSSSYSPIKAVWNGTAVRVEIWGANNVKASTSVTVSFNGSVTRVVTVVGEYSNVAALGASTTTTGSGSGSISLATQDSGNWIVGGWAVVGSSTAPSTGTIWRQAQATAGGPNAVAGALTDNTSASPVATSLTVSSGLNWAAAAVELRTVCTTLDANYVAVTAQTGQATVYWASSNPVLILRKVGALPDVAPTNFSITEVPAGGYQYSVNETIPLGGTAGAPNVATVVFSGAGGEKSFVDTGVTNGYVYHYKVFAKDPGVTACYAPGAASTEAQKVKPTAGPHPAWSYTMAGGATLKAGIAGQGTLYSSSTAKRIFSLSTATGLQTWTPVASTDLVQGWLSWTPVGSGWKYRKKLTIDPTMVVTGPHTDFPVLVSRTDPDLIGSKTHASGNDILFTASDGLTKLSHEIEKFNNATGELVAWVKVPSVSSSAPGTSIYMYYGNPTASNQEDPVNVWTSSFVGVWHLKEDPAGTAPQMKDSTTNANHGTTQGGMLATDQVAGQIAGALRFDGSNDYVMVPDNALLRITGNGTVTAWAKRAATGNWDAIVDKSSGNTSGRNYGFEWNTTDQIRGDVGDGNSSSTGVLSSTLASTTKFYYFALVWDGTNVKLYVDGQLNISASQTFTAGGNMAALYIGLRGGNVDPFGGIIDEVRVAKGARSAGWITTEYNNQNLPATFFSFVGAEESTTTSTTGAVVGGDQSGNVYSVDTVSGGAKWTQALAGGNKFLATVAGQLKAYSPALTDPLNDCPIGGADINDDLIFLATRNSSSTNNKVFALRASSGSQCWTFSPGDMGDVGSAGMPWVDYTPLASSRNLLYVTGRAGSTGQSLWVLSTLNGTPASCPACTSLNGVHLETSPSLSYNGNTLYVASSEGTGKLYKIDATDRTLKWTFDFEVDGGVPAGHFLQGFVWEDGTGKLYFSTSKPSNPDKNGALWSLQDNGLTRTLLWKRLGGETVPAGVWPAGTTLSVPLLLDALYEGLYVGGSDGKLYKVDLNGNPVGTAFPVDLTPSTVGAPSTETGAEIFAATEAGAIYKIPLPW